MSHYIETYRKHKHLVLTVLEYFADADIVHEHCQQQLDLTGLDHPRDLAKRLLSSSEVLRNRTHRLYYVVPLRSGMVMPLDDYIAYDVFFEWFRRHVGHVYAVIVNGTTKDYEKVKLLKIIIITKYYNIIRTVNCFLHVARICDLRNIINITIMHHVELQKITCIQLYLYGTHGPSQNILFHGVALCATCLGLLIFRSSLAEHMSNFNMNIILNGNYVLLKNYIYYFKKI